MTLVEKCAGALLVDSRGRILLQLRTSDARVDAGKWNAPGGRLEPGEDPLMGARRELVEETGLIADYLALYEHGSYEAQAGFDAVEAWTFYGPTDARDEQVQCLEGQAMLFVPAAQLHHLEYGGILQQIMPRFLQSQEYQELCR